MYNLSKNTANTKIPVIHLESLTRTDEDVKLIIGLQEMLQSHLSVWHVDCFNGNRNMDFHSKLVFLIWRNYVYQSIRESSIYMIIKLFTNEFSLQRLCFETFLWNGICLLDYDLALIPPHEVLMNEMKWYVITPWSDHSYMQSKDENSFSHGGDFTTNFADTHRNLSYISIMGGKFPVSCNFLVSG